MPLSITSREVPIERSKDQSTGHEWCPADHVPFSSLFSLFLFLSLSPLSLSVSSLCACVHRGAWTNAVQRLRAALHQLHQRKAAAVLQSPHVRARTGRVRAWRYRVDLHRFRHGFGTDDQSDREGKAMGPRRTRTQYSGSLDCDSVMHSFALEFSLPIVEFATVLPILCVSCHFVLSRLCMY